MVIKQSSLKEKAQCKTDASIKDFRKKSVLKINIENHY